MGKYDDIINLPHWEPSCHRRMSSLDRAGQFAPFAALTGYDAMVMETSRLTGKRQEPDEDQLRSLNDALNGLLGRVAAHPTVSIVHFVRDARKAGGEYLTSEGPVQNVELPERRILLRDGRAVALDDIIDLTVLD